MILAIANSSPLGMAIGMFGIVLIVLFAMVAAADKRNGFWQEDYFGDGDGSGEWHDDAEH